MQAICEAIFNKTVETCCGFARWNILGIPECRCRIAFSEALNTLYGHSRQRDAELHDFRSKVSISHMSVARHRFLVTCFQTSAQLFYSVQRTNIHRAEKVDGTKFETESGSTKSFAQCFT